MTTGRERLTPALVEHDAREVDELVVLCDLRLTPDDRVVEIGVARAG